MENALKNYNMDELIQQIVRFSDVTEYAGIMVYETDLQSDEIHYFHGIEKVMGMPFKRGLTRKWWQSLIHPDDLEKYPLPNSCTPFTSDYRVRHHDGHYVYVLEHTVVTCSAHGQPIRHTGTIQDVTSLKRAELQMKESERRKEQFLAMLAHELRNPLATIQNGIAIMNMPRAPSHMIDEIKTMMTDQADHILRLVDDLLDISRINRGKIVLRKEDVDLVAVLEKTIKTYRSAFRGKGIQFCVDLPKGPVFINGDTVRLIQIFGNLLHNAAKYTNPGGTVELRLKRNGKKVTVQIEDNGIGIPAERLASIFNVYERVDIFSDVNTEGLGLGLALVKELVELHGGEVEAESDGCNKGSKFTVTLVTVKLKRV